MRRLVLQAISLALTLSLSCVASAGSVQLPPAKILSVVALEGLDILRIEISTLITIGDPTPLNPAGCDFSPFLVDIQLDVPGRSAEEQRLLVNAVYLAFMTNRNVSLFIRDDVCSTAGTSFRLRVANGIQVFD